METKPKSETSEEERDQPYNVFSFAKEAGRNYVNIEDVDRAINVGGGIQVCLDLAYCFSGDIDFYIEDHRLAFARASKSAIGKTFVPVDLKDLQNTKEDIERFLSDEPIILTSPGAAMFIDGSEPKKGDEEKIHILYCGHFDEPLFALAKRNDDGRWVLHRGEEIIEDSIIVKTARINDPTVGDGKNG